MKKTLILLCLLSPIIALAQLRVIEKVLNKDDSRLDDMVYLYHKNIVQSMEEENFIEIYALFTDGLKEKLDSSKLASSWKKIVPFDSLEIVPLLDFAQKRTSEATYYLSGFSVGEEKYDLQTVFKEDSLTKKLKISSFRIKPYQQKIAWEAPEYVDPEKVECKSLKVAGPDSLFAELCYPKGKNLEETPIAVMVHGSGPNDMDETLGPNKLFKDLAYGLATNGIASLRYNKRTFDYPIASSLEPTKLTASTLVIDDAVKAIEQARKYTDAEIYLIGHSMGGYFAPAIAERANPDMVVSLAGSISPIEDLLIDQFDYLRANDSSTKITDFVYKSIKWQIKNLKEGNYDSTTIDATLPLGIPGSFWISVKEYNPGETAKKQDIPYLIMNGSRDYQVTEEEAKSWEKYLKHKWSEVIIYEGMNHMFFEGEGILLPSEYEQKAHMEEVVLIEMLQWLAHE